MPRPHHPSRRKRRPFRRRAWTLTITSALLAVVWVGSMKVWVPLWTDKTSGIDLWRGLIVLWQTQQPFDIGFPNWYIDLGDWDIRWWGWAQSLPKTQSRQLAIPLWPFILLTGVPGVWMLIKTRKHTNPHACPACGYDRTGLPQSPTGPAACPECGPECGKT